MDPAEVLASDSHRDDRNAGEGSAVGVARAPRTATSIGSQGQRDEVMVQVLRVVETPRLNRKEFHMERVFDASESKCKAKIGGVACKTPVSGGALQPGFDGTFVFYKTDTETGVRKKVRIERTMCNKI